MRALVGPKEKISGKKRKNRDRTKCSRRSDGEVSLDNADAVIEGAPITRAETEKQNVPKQSSSHRLSRQEPGAQVRQDDRPQICDSFTGDSAVLERCRRRMVVQDGVASRRRMERPRRVRRG